MTRDGDQGGCFLAMLFADEQETGGRNEDAAGGDHNQRGSCETRELEEEFRDCPAASWRLNPMEWWSEKQNVFPTLALLARKFLAIRPATSAPSAERIFSVAAQQVVGKLKGKMHPDTASTLIFLNSNKEEL